MIPSSDQLAENIRKLVDGLAREIADRVVRDYVSSTINDIGINVEYHANAVLLDWFLGDFIPGRAE